MMQDVPTRFCRALPEDVPALKSLWAEVFGDEPAFIDLFFSRMFRPEDYVLLRHDETDEILSAAALLPVDLVCGETRFPISYLYGMMTRPSEQGKGYGLRLLQHAAQYCRENGKAGIALQPADEGLLYFYKKAGYAPAFSRVPNPSCYIGYPPYFLEFAKEAGYKVPPAQSAQGDPSDGETAMVPGVFLSFRQELRPENAWLAYPLD